MFITVDEWAGVLDVELDDALHAMLMVCSHWFKCGKRQCVAHRREVEKDNDAIGFEIVRDAKRRRKVVEPVQKSELLFDNDTED